MQPSKDEVVTAIKFWDLFSVHRGVRLGAGMKCVYIDLVIDEENKESQLMWEERGVRVVSLSYDDSRAEVAV